MSGMRARVVWLVLGLASALGACREKAAPSAAAPPAPAPRSVTTVAVVRVAEGGDAEVPGVVQALQRATLASRLQAAIVELPFREGDRVAAGAVVARLDAAAAESAVAAAAAASQAAAADERRVASLLARGAATPREADEAATRAAAAQAALQAARNELTYAVLRAPFSGLVASRPVHVGDVVAPGVPVLEVEGEDGFEVRATLDGALAVSVRPGLTAQAIVDGQPRALPATLRAVSPAGDPTTHRFEVRATLPAADGLRSGLFARLILPATAVGDARLLVPEASVLRRGGLSGLFVVAGGRARLRWVALGDSSAGNVEVRAGVAAGERIALDPAGLVDGAVVREEG